LLYVIYLAILQIQEKQYGEALQLAFKYNLDKDLVYKHQWCNSSVLEESINNILVCKTIDYKYYRSHCSTKYAALNLIAILVLHTRTEYAAYLNTGSVFCTAVTSE